VIVKYYLGSARNYAGLDNDLEVILLDFFEIDCDYLFFFATNSTDFSNKQITE
jgi:hypothetical protein